MQSPAVPTGRNRRAKSHATAPSTAMNTTKSSQRTIATEDTGITLETKQTGTTETDNVVHKDA